MNLKRILLAFAVTAGLAASTAAQEIGVTVVQYGIYTADVTAAPKVGPNGEVRSVQITNLCHVESTRTVPARDKLHFGFRYRVNGPVPGEPVEIRRVFHFPEHAKPPGWPKPEPMDEDTTRVRVGQVTYVGWVLFHNKPGAWSFELFHADHRLAEMTFTVIEAGPVAAQRNTESTCFLLSGLSQGAERIAAR